MDYPAGYYSKWATLSKNNYKGMFWKGNQPDKDTILKLAFLGQVEKLTLFRSRCKTLPELLAINNNDKRHRDPKNCGKINAINTPYFDGGLVKMIRPGRHGYFSSRNNNFSNRK